MALSSRAPVYALGSASESAETGTQRPFSLWLGLHHGSREQWVPCTELSPVGGFSLESGGPMSDCSPS